MKTIATILLVLLVIAPAFADSIHLECQLEAALFNMAVKYREGHFGPWIDYKNHWHDSVKGGYTLQHAFRDLGSLKFAHAMPKKTRDRLISEAFASPTIPGPMAGPRVLNECMARHHQAPIAPEVHIRTYCTDLGIAYTLAAAIRDKGQYPQVAYSEIRSAYSAAAIPDDKLEKVIHNVYFDRRFAQAGGSALGIQMQDLCLQRYAPRTLREGGSK